MRPSSHSDADALAFPKTQPGVLVASGDPDLRTELRGLLGDRYQLRFCNDAASCLATASANPTDLILLDGGLHGMEMVHLLDEVNSQRALAALPVLLITPAEQPNPPAALLAAGISEVIGRPLSPELLQLRLHNQLRLKFRTDLLQRLTTADAQSGAANRRAYDDTLIKEWRRCGRSESPMALALARIDALDGYRRRYGEERSEACMKAVVTTLIDNLFRPHDLVARYDQDTFAILLPETPLGGAQQKAIDLEARVRRLEIAHLTSATADVVTLSIGVAGGQPADGQGSETMLDAAREALEAALEAGGGQVVARGY